MTPQERARAIRDGATQPAVLGSPPASPPGGAVAALRAARAATARPAPQPRRPAAVEPSTAPDALGTMQYGTGEYTELRPQAVESELALKYMGQIGAREGGLGTLPSERQAQIEDEARARAREEVAARVGTSERRGNMLVSTDEQQLLDDIKEGRTWLGLATGQYGLNALVERFTGNNPIEDWVDQKLAPFHAIAKPGWTSADIADGEDISKPQREGKGWWLLRASPLQPIMSYVMSDDPDMEWGDDEHLRKIQSYDYTEDWYRMGEAIYGWTPEVMKAALNPAMYAYGATGMVDDKTVDKVITAQLGLAATGAMIWLDPDALSVGSAGVGKVLGGAMKTGSLINTAVVKPAKVALGEMQTFRKLGDSVAATGSKILEKYGPNSPQMRIYTAAVNNTIGRLVNEGLSSAGDLGVSDLGKVEAEAAKLASEASESAKALDDANSAVKVATFRQAAAMDAIPHVDAAAKADVDGVEAAARKAASGEAEKFFQDFVTGHEAHVRSKQALEEVLAARGMGIHANAEDFAELLEQAKGVRMKMSTIVKRIDKLMKERREMMPPFNVNRFDEIEKEIHSLAKMKAALEAKALANGTDLAVAALMKRLQTAERGMEAMRRVGAKKYGIAADRLNEAAEAAARSGKRTHKVVDEVADAAAKAARPGVDAAVAKATARGAAARAKAIADADRAGREGIATVDSMLSAEQKMVDKLEQHRLVSSAEDMFDAELKRILGEADNFQKLVAAGTMAPKAFKYASSAVKAALAGGSVDVAVLRAEAMARYGSVAAEELVKLAEALPAKPTWRDIQGLRRAEEAAHIAAEQTRLGAHATLRNVADQFVTGTKPGPSDQYTMAQRVLRGVSTAGRAIDSMRRWGADMVPETLRKITSKAVHRIAGIEAEIDDVAHAWGLDGVWRHMVESVPVAIKDRNSVMGGYGHRGLDYLRMVAASGSAAWDEDATVKALANAWQPSGKAGEDVAGRVRHSLYGYITNGGGLEGLREWFRTDAKAAWFQPFDKVDKPEVAERFFVRGLAQAANMYDAVIDYHRVTSNLGLNAQMAKAMNFLAEPNNTKVAGNLLEARNAAQALGIPLAKNVRNIFFGQEKQGELLRLVAKTPTGEVWMSERYWKGLQSIPSRLAKELDQFHDAGSAAETTKRGLMQFLQAWRMGVLFGAVLPRPGMFTASMIGDWSQMCVTLGFTPATRITAQNLVTNIPFIGRKLQDQMSNLARRNSVVAALFDPNLAQVMRASDDVIIETADGPMSAAHFMREAIEDGAHDAIGSGDLAELTARVKSTSVIRKLTRYLTGAEITPLIKATTRMFESVQFRTRMSLYLEARTGRMTGKAMSRAEAADALSKALYDYRTGPTDIELNSIARISAFWVYRRNMLRQLGSALTEGLSNPDVVMAGKALTGNTAIGRARKGAYALQWAPDVLDWSDEDGDEFTLGDASTDRLGMHTAPWWVTNKHWLTNIPIGPTRRDWNKENLGRDAPYESVVLNGLVFADMIWTMNLWSQTAAAVAAQAGLIPGTTSAPWKDIAETNIDQFTDGLLPGIDKAVEGLMKRLAGIEMRETPESAASDQTMALRKLAGVLRAAGMDGMIFTDDKGRTKIDNGFMGLVFNIVTSHPMLVDTLRHVRNIDNANMAESTVLGVIEALVRESGAVSIAPNDPWASRRHEVDSQQRALKDLKADANKRK